MPRVIRWTALAFLLLPGCASTAPPRWQSGEHEAPVTPVAAGGGDSSARGETDQEAAAAPEAGVEAEVPFTAAQALSLWEERGPAVLPLLATFFQMVDLTGDEQQGSFDLLREISAAVEPDDPAASSVLTATGGFLRLPVSAAVRLPGESSVAPWTDALRLVVGLRSSRELGPVLVEMVRSRTGDALDPDSDVIRNAVYGIACLAYVPGSAIVRRYARECRTLERRVLALEMLALLGDPSGADVVIEMIETGEEPALIQPAARTLQILLGEAAEPALVALLGREEPELQRAALGPLFSIGTPSALARIVALSDETTDRTTQRVVETLLERYGRPLGLSAAELERLIRSSPEEAARRIGPYVRLLEDLTDDDRRLSREDLSAVLEHWRNAGTLYTSEWSWVRDRHIVSVATPGDEPALEAVRRAVLRGYRSTSLNEAHIVQRMILAIRARARHRE